MTFALEHDMEVATLDTRAGSAGRIRLDLGLEDDLSAMERARSILRRLGLGRSPAVVPEPVRPKAWLHPEEEQRVPPRELWIGPDDSIHHYYRWIWEYLAYLTLLCELKRDGQVLELGCGHGRTARGLLEYLRAPGGYCGLDVDARRLADARERIERRYPNFRFIHADLWSADYNPRAVASAADYVFPFDDATFDVAYAASLFTHLLPDEARNYLGQTRRVLKRGGRALFSAFVLDHYRGPGTSVSPLYEFHHELEPGVCVRDRAHPDALVGYSRAWLEEAVSRAGLRLERLIPGLWAEGPGFAVNEQDLLLLVRDS
jgi:SAM-dependent methyltransferase